MTAPKNIKIENLDKDYEFIVPDGYFEHLSDKIMSKIDNDDSRITDNRNALTKTAVIRWMSVAAAIFIAILVYNSSVYECKTFACLLDSTTIEDKDLEWIEEEDGIVFFEDEDEYIF